MPITLSRSAMKRKFEICKKCKHISSRCNYSYLCSPFYQCDIESFANGRFCMNLIVQEEWNEYDIPNDCEMYAEYFVEDCNEEKI